MAISHPDDPSEGQQHARLYPLDGVRFRLSPCAVAAGIGEGSGRLECLHPFGFDGYVGSDGTLRGKVLDDDGWWPTSDIARLDAAGRVELLGREDRQVKRCGVLVDCAMVEDTLRSLDGVAEVAVVPAGLALRGIELTLYYVPAGTSPLPDGQLRSASRQLLPAEAVPDRYVACPSLPRLSNGKIDVRRLSAAGTHWPPGSSFP